MAFPFEKLEVYRRSLKFVSEVEAILEREKSQMTRNLADQLSRATLSIPLNIAEGNGRWHTKDKRQFFWISRGSCFECIPILEILFIKSKISEEEHRLLRTQLNIIGKMLTRLIQVHADGPEKKN